MLSQIFNCVYDLRMVYSLAGIIGTVTAYTLRLVL